VGKLAFAGAFFGCFAASELNYIFTNNVHVYLNCVYPAVLKSPKQLTNVAET
jgi:hypothetical protein